MAASEQDTGFRNASLANFMQELRAPGQIRVNEVLAIYCHQCALEMTARQLAQAGFFLPMTGGCAPDGPHALHQSATRPGTSTR